ncbi:MAG: 3TM-type holin [Afipia sp.]|nr:3TM-type holin [Afipia sp.]
MDWGDIAKQVIGLGAPILGTALGGPLGGAAGRILAEVVGASDATPEAVGRALTTSSADQITQAENVWAEAVRAEAEAVRSSVAETQATIRAELSSEDLLQRLWRPLYALELTFECAALWVVLVHEFWTGDMTAINALIGATGLLVSYWGFRFGVLGVYMSGRTREKVCAATGQDARGPFGQGVLGKLVKAVVTKK